MGINTLPPHDMSKFIKAVEAGDIKLYEASKHVPVTLAQRKAEMVTERRRKPDSIVSMSNSIPQPPVK